MPEGNEPDEIVTQVERFLDAGYVIHSRVLPSGRFMVQLCGPTRLVGYGNSFAEAFENARNDR